MMEDLQIKLPKRFYTAMEKLIVKLYKKCEIHHSAINPFEIINKLGFALIPYSKVNKNVLEKYLGVKKDIEAFSFYVVDFHTFLICYDDSKVAQRVRFTLMHEVGHILLGHKEESALAKKEADAFAAYALAPYPVIYKIGCEDYMDICCKFDVSEECGLYIFTHYLKWLRYSGNIKSYEQELMDLIDK